MNNNNTDPTPDPSPTREGRTMTKALPSLVGERLRVGELSSGMGSGVGSVTIYQQITHT